MPRRPGISRYPLSVGAVIKFHQIRSRYNRKIGAYVDHELYLWIRRYGWRPPRKSEHYRKIHCTLVYIPKLSGMRHKYLAYNRIVRKMNLRTMLAGGCVQLGVVEFYYKTICWVRFFEMIGVLDTKKPLLEDNSIRANLSIFQ